MIVISLKEEFYAKADALIGIYPEVTHPLSVRPSLLGRAAAGVLQGGLRLTLLFKEIRLKSNYSGFSMTVQRFKIRKSKWKITEFSL